MCTTDSARAQYSYPYKQIGTTKDDLQIWNSVGRQIAIGGGRLHFCWTDIGDASKSQGIINYFSYNLNNWADTIALYGLHPDEGGITPVLDFDVATGSGRAIVNFQLKDSASIVLARNSGPASNSFSFVIGQNGPGSCEGVITSSPTEYRYYFPDLILDYDGSNLPVGHMVLTEPGYIQPSRSLVYRRSSAGLNGFSSTCSHFIDSVLTESASIAQDPNSDRVAITYTGMNNDDVYCVQSTNMGQTWQSPTNISQYQSTLTEKAFTVTDVLYTQDGCLHIVWVARVREDLSQSYSKQKARLLHWDSCNQCKSQISFAEREHPCGVDPLDLNISQISLSECTVGGSSRLYVVYKHFTGDNDCGIPYPGVPPYPNSEIYAQVSTDQGVSWGAPLNLTNTPSPGCTIGNCSSELGVSIIPYATDTLRLFFQVDKVPGPFEKWWYDVQLTDNPLISMSVPCFAATPHYGLSPVFIQDSASVVVDGTVPYVDTSLVIMRNDGNLNQNYTLDVQYESSGGWIAFPDNPGGNGTIGIGCTNSDTVRVRIYGPPDTTFSLNAIVRLLYDDSPGDQDTVQIKVTAVNKAYYSSTYSVISTPEISLAITPEGRVGAQAGDHGFEYADGSQFLYDGSLVLGNSANNLTWSIFGDGPGDPSPTNLFGRFIPLTGLTFDSSLADYTTATSRATDRDSTLGVTITHYAPQFVDSAEFFVLHYDVYKGMKNPTGTASNLDIAFVCDWDIPSNLNYANSFKRLSSNAISQSGLPGAPWTTYQGGMVVYKDGYASGVQGFSLDNDLYVYPDNNFENDQFWTLIDNGAGATVTAGKDLSSIVVVARDVVINGAAADTFSFSIILAGSQEANVQANLTKGKNFMCQYIAEPGACTAPSCMCGDSDNNGIWTISDAVFLISYIFKGGPAPAQSCLGDADGNGIITISDVVFMIGYIFAGGPAPNCP